MYAIDTEIVIPKYSLAADLVTGSTLFAINKIANATNYLRKDFLTPHRKDYYFWAFVKQGSSRHWIDMKPYTLQPNTFYFTIPHQVHLKEDTSPLTAISLGFTEEFLTLEENSFLRQLPIIQNQNNGHELNLSDADVTFIEDMLEKIYQENQTHNTWQHSMVIGYLRILMIYLSRLYTEQFNEAGALPDRVLLKRYLTKIEENYQQQHDVATYADMLNLSAGHLSEVVKEQSGKPAIVHIHERLILETKRLLFHTDHSIKEIAFRLGFEEASYFNRFFKRIVGDTPVSYRTTIREMYH
ncbi:helix-turn-helix domain-containing protein [Mucilaginibacter antarcticus]|uniref:AraC family transcriptional regulator n=1 Tax=Mucilaginibacter antarcticus TaxID=1855725 RepID=A0ABW5XUC1_9SPHI